MPAPMNFKLDRPSVTVPNWAVEEPLWVQLNQEIGGNPAFFPLTVKGAYVIGVIHGLCESVSILLERLPGVVSLMPAYGVFASAIEILGRYA